MSIISFGFLLASFLAAVLPGTAVAQASYKVGVGDVLDVKVFGEAEFTGSFRVSPDGTINYPFLRKIEAKGKSTDEIARHLTELLKDGYLNDPQVSVEVKDYRSQTVMVLGAVSRPGTYVLEQDTRILDLLSKAGGILPAGGKRVLFLRPPKPAGKADPESPPDVTKLLATGDTKPVVIDYYKLTHEGDMTQNLLLKDGDILNVPKANEIFVLGSVGRPGPIPFEENMTILQAVTLAGGPTPMASTRSTYILRQGPKGEEKIDVRFDKVIESKAKNETVKPDDVIVVPESFF